MLRLKIFEKSTNKKIKYFSKAFWNRSQSNTTFSSQEYPKPKTFPSVAKKKYGSFTNKKNQHSKKCMLTSSIFTSTRRKLFCIGVDFRHYNDDMVLLSFRSYSENWYWNFLVWPRKQTIGTTVYLKKVETQDLLLSSFGTRCLYRIIVYPRLFRAIFVLYYTDRQKYLHVSNAGSIVFSAS